MEFVLALDADTHEEPVKTTNGFMSCQRMQEKKSVKCEVIHMSDYIVRVTAANAAIRAFAVTGRELVGREKAHVPGRWSQQPLKTDDGE